MKKRLSSTTAHEINIIEISRETNPILPRGRHHHVGSVLPGANQAAGGRLEASDIESAGQTVSSGQLRMPRPGPRHRTPGSERPTRSGWREITAEQGRRRRLGRLLAAAGRRVSLLPACY